MRQPCGSPKTSTLIPNAGATPAPFSKEVQATSPPAVMQRVANIHGKRPAANTHPASSHFQHHLRGFRSRYIPMPITELPHGLRHC
jgi:hypothetical protein